LPAPFRANELGVGPADSTHRDAPPELFAAARDGDAAAREELVRRYMPLARSLALRFRGRSEPLDDLVQVAAIGLVIALGRFDPDRGLAFSSFAVPTILGELRRHFRDRTWAVHMPRRLQERSAHLGKVADELARDLGRHPTVDELAARTGLGEEEVLDGLQAGAAYRASSLDRPLNANDDEPMSSLLGSEEDGFRDVEARLTVAATANRLLTRRQRRVLWLHVDHDLTQEEIARRVGISQMQVSRDLGAARDALREAL
jgi:RNA polymerase sigma-B factor